MTIYFRLLLILFTVFTGTNCANIDQEYSSKPCDNGSNTVDGKCIVTFYSHGRLIIKKSTSNLDSLRYVQERVDFVLLLGYSVSQTSQEDISAIIGDDIRFFELEAHPEDANAMGNVNFTNPRQNEWCINCIYSLDQEIQLHSDNFSFNWGTDFVIEVTAATTTDGFAQVFVSPVSEGTGVEGIYFEVGLEDRSYL